METKSQKMDSLHTYGPMNRIVQYLFVLPFTIILLLLSGSGLISLVVRLLHPVSTTGLGVLDSLALFGFSGIAGCGVLSVANSQPEIRVYADGLKIRAFFFWWMFVPWQEIRSIERPIALSWSRSHHLVTVAHLTFIHRLTGWTFGHRFEPAFLIRKNLAEYGKVIEIIERHIQ